MYLGTRQTEPRHPDPARETPSTEPSAFFFITLFSSAGLWMAWGLSLGPNAPSPSEPRVPSLHTPERPAPSSSHSFRLPAYRWPGVSIWVQYPEP